MENNRLAELQAKLKELKEEDVTDPFADNEEVIYDAVF